MQVALSTSLGRSALVELALLVEQLGYGGLWLTELAGHDAFSLLTEIGLRTDRIGLGTGIVNIYGRSPATLAQAAASLSELLDGRAFNLGLGTSSRAVVERLHGLPFERPYQRMAETLRLVQMALAGQRLELNGEVFRVGGFRLGVRPRGPVSLYVAGLAGPMLAVTGRYADGWLPNLPSRRGFPALRAEVAAAAARAERPMPTSAAYLYTAVGADAAAEEPLRRTIAWYLASGGAGYRSLFQRYGYGDLVDQVATSWAQGRRDEARALVTTELIRDLCLAGPARTLPAQLAAYAALGVDLPIVRFPDGLEPDRQVAMLREIAAALSAAS